VKFNPLTLIDGYKADHRSQYPEGTEFVFSNWTPRSDKLSNIPEEDRDGVVFFGLQHFMFDVLVNSWEDDFFSRPKDRVVGKYRDRMAAYLGLDDFDVTHIEALWELGYLPLRIRAVREGTVVPYRVPMFTVENTLPEFFWLTNYFETILSATIWKGCTSATTARFYRKLFDHYADLTGSSVEVIGIQAHDFSFRGMSGVEDAALSGAAHLLSFIGTDTLPALDLIEHSYLPNSVHGQPVHNGILGVGVAATEHSVMCAGGEDDEAATFDRIAFDVYPTGIVSIVSDTWDFWSIMTEYLPSRKDRILARDGKVVIRPDSGDPVKIICGDPIAERNSPEWKGAIRLLWETFGGTFNEKGFKELHPSIGLIYGDSITPVRAKEILNRLYHDGFAASNVVLGIGSYTYEYVTRDTHGFAMKATYAQVKGEGRMLFKDPKTDGGTKKSLRGKFSVVNDPDEGLVVLDGQHNTDGCVMTTVFLDGGLTAPQTFSHVRATLAAQ